MGPIAHVPHHPCPPSRSNRHWQYSLNTWSCTCSPCAHVISQVSKRCQVVKKMSNIKKSNVQTMEEVHKKNKLTSWSSQILTLILTSNMKVTKIAQKYFLWTFWGFLVTIICDVKIDINICEPHCVNLFFLWTSSIVQVFDFLTFDIFLTTWHLFDNLTTFWYFGSKSPMGPIAHIPVPHCPCIALPMWLIPLVPHTYAPIAHVPHTPSGPDCPYAPYPQYPIAHVTHCPCAPSPLSPI